MDFILDTPFNELTGINISGREFTEVCALLDSCDALFEDEDMNRLFEEEVIHPGKKVRENAKMIAKNTADTTKSVGGLYGDITTAAGKGIKATVDLTIKIIGVIIKVATFILNRLTDLAKGIGFVSGTIGRIPETIRNRLKGNIELYITANSLEEIYNEGAVKDIDTFISLARSVSKGEMWGRFGAKRGNDDDSHGHLFGDNDIKTCKKMDAVYHRLKGVQFTKSTIDMGNYKMIDIYFGAKPNVTFRDLKGGKFAGNYYAALQQLVNDINARRDDIKEIHDAISKKYDASLMNDAFARMNAHDQDIITRMISQISRVVNIVANIVRYSMMDMNTIKGAADKAMKAREKIANKANKENAKAAAANV